MSWIEILLLIFLVALLVASALFYFVAYSPQAKLDRALSGAHTLSTVLSQYATDNNGVYPVGEGTPAAGKSEGIALDLLQNSYLPDASAFSVGSTPKYSGKGGDFADLSAENMSWDFTAGANASTGIGASAPDLLPVVFTTGEMVTYPKTPGQGANVALSGKGPFGMTGMIVAYKSNNVVFLGTTFVNGQTLCPNFISTAFTDTSTYTQIKP